MLYYPWCQRKLVQTLLKTPQKHRNLSRRLLKGRSPTRLKNLKELEMALLKKKRTMKGVAAEKMDRTNKLLVITIVMTKKKKKSCKLLLSDTTKSAPSTI